MIRSNTIQATYDRCSFLYDAFFKPWLEFGRRAAVEALELNGGERVLEIGVGTGLSLEHYPPDVEVIGMDYSAGMLQGSREKIQRNDVQCRVDLLQMDAQALSFPTETFDRIMAAYVLTVVPHPEKAIEEVLRVARPGARVVLINHLRSDNRLFAWLEDLFHPLFATIGLFNLDRNLLEVLRSCGITDIVCQPTSFLGLHHVISFTVPEKRSSVVMP